MIGYIAFSKKMKFKLIILLKKTITNLLLIEYVLIFKIKKGLDLEILLYHVY